MLDDYIQTNGLNAQILRFDQEVANSTQATALERTLPVAKTLLFRHANGLTLVILEGNKKVDLIALGTIVGAKDVKLATPAEVEETTGYSVGGVPPISIYGTPTLIDEGVLTHAWVVAGGGDSFSLLKIQSKDILAHAYEPQVVRVAK